MSKKTSVSHRFEKKTIAIASPQKFGHRSSLTLTMIALIIELVIELVIQVVTVNGVIELL